MSNPYPGLTRLCFALALYHCAPLFAAQPADLLQLVQNSCNNQEQPLTFKGVIAEQSPLKFRQLIIGTRRLWTLDDESEIELQHRAPPGRPSQTLLQYKLPQSQPLLQITLDQDCSIIQLQRIVYDNDDRALHIESLNSNFEKTGNIQWLNPPVPQPSPAAQQRSLATAVRVGLIDSGVNYLLPTINNSLARDDTGNIIGYDFWDLDDRPFDANPASSAFHVQRHGTRTASILLSEAPTVGLVPYRYPRADMSRMQALIDHAIQHNVKLIGMPLGSNKYQDWAMFARAAEARPEVLFIASAGNNGRDIDLSPVYPAALEIDNLLVVTSANDFVQPATRTNFGRIAVDYLVPAEAIRATDFDGSQTSVSGSSYAVPRLLALAARLLEKEPQLDTRALKNKIQQFATRGRTGRYVSTGYIADPLADVASVTIDSIENSDGQKFVSSSSDSDWLFTLDIAILDEGWQHAEIEAAIKQQADIFNQCKIAVKVEHYLSVTADERLGILSTGNAHTLMSHLRKVTTNPLAIFATDTAMQTPFDAEAFGAGNTGNRPWLTNSVWLTRGINDIGIALAHEFFHVLSNSGEHRDNLANNLMRTRTQQANTKLNSEQCDTAIEFAVRQKLLQQQ